MKTNINCLCQAFYFLIDDTLYNIYIFSNMHQSCCYNTLLHIFFSTKTLTVWQRGLLFFIS